MVEATPLGASRTGSGHYSYMVALDQTLVLAKFEPAEKHPPFDPGDRGWSPRRRGVDGCGACPWQGGPVQRVVGCPVAQQGGWLAALPVVRPPCPSREPSRGNARGGLTAGSWVARPGSAPRARGRHWLCGGFSFAGRMEKRRRLLFALLFFPLPSCGSPQWWGRTRGGPGAGRGTAAAGARGCGVAVVGETGARPGNGSWL